MAAAKAITTRRGMFEVLLGLGAAVSLQGALDGTAWRAYESIEEAWIRDRHLLLVKQTPAAAAIAKIDLELKLAELRRRGAQFKHLLRCNPRQLRGGIWQLSFLPFNQVEEGELQSDSNYHRLQERVRSLAHAVQEHPDNRLLRQAQTHLWKTPEYREIHQRYSGRMQELSALYGGLNETTQRRRP